MIKIRIPKVDLDEELFIRRNIFQAYLVALNVLAHNDPKFMTEVLNRVVPAQVGIGFERFLFDAMSEQIKEEGKVDIEQVRCNIPLWVDSRGSPEFVAKCLANYALMLSYHPTAEQIERAIQLITSPRPLRKGYLPRKEKRLKKKEQTK